MLVQKWITHFTSGGLQKFYLLSDIHAIDEGVDMGAGPHLSPLTSPSHPLVSLLSKSLWAAHAKFSSFSLSSFLPNLLPSPPTHSSSFRPSSHSSLCLFSLFPPPYLPLPVLIFPSSYSVRPLKLVDITRVLSHACPSIDTEPNFLLVRVQYTVHLTWRNLTRGCLILC